MFFQEGVEANTWQQLFDDPLVNTSGAICSYCGSSNNPNVGQFVDAPKTSIMNALAIRGLCGTNCGDDGAIILNILQSFLREPDASSPNPSTSHGKETPGSFHVAQQVQYMLVTWKCSQ
jgi:hypothetical protein